MTCSVVIPAIGQQELLDECVEYLAENVVGVVPIYVIDNGSKVPLKSEFANVIRNEENRGMVGSLKQAVEMCNTDVLVYQHSDLFMYEHGWDEQVLRAFEQDPKLGIIGVVGAEWATKDGGRAHVWCSFRDWRIHGHKPRTKITPVALLDGCYMAFRRSMMEELGLPEVYGDGNEYFFYDKEISLTATMASWRVGVIDLDCDHLGGRTSCSEEFTKTIHTKSETHDIMYARSERRYLDKWGPCFDVRVAPDWTVHVSK